VCATVGLAVLVLGGSMNTLLGFVTGQTSRGLQIESVAATPLVISHAMAGRPLATYSKIVLTWEVNGAASPIVARVLDLALPVMLLALAWLAYRARHLGQGALVVGALAAVSGVIVLNKVGSPQFMDWLVAPVVMGLALWPKSERWRVLGALVAVCAALTHLIYPIAYGSFLAGEAGMVGLWAMRNLIVVAIFVSACVRLWQMGGGRLRPNTGDGGGAGGVEGGQGFLQWLIQASDHLGAHGLGDGVTGLGDRPSDSAESVGIATEADRQPDSLDKPRGLQRGADRLGD
jgi:hypothetical protein